jgi:PPP family 3-phenylpropionic acid transporter
LRESRTLGACAALSFAYFTFAALFTTYVPLWFESLGLSLIAIGWLMSLPSWTRLFASFTWGALADRRGSQVPLIRLAAVLSLLAACGFLLPGNAWLLGLATFALYAFNAAITPLTETVVAARLATADGGVDARRYGRVRLWGSLGYLASVLGFGWIFERFGMGGFVPAMLLTLLLMLAAAFQVPNQRLAAHAHAPGPPLGEVLRRPVVRWFLAGVFLTVLAHQALYCFFSLYLDRQGHGKASVGLLWGVGVAAEIGWFALQGRMMERGTVHHWLTAAAWVAALRFALTAAFGAHLWILVLLQLSHAMTFAAQHLACVALISRYFPGRLRGRGQAIYLVIGYGLSGVIGAVGGGWLVSAWGLSSAFWAASLMALAGALCCWRSLRLQ